MEGSHTGLNLRIMSIQFSLYKHRNLNYQKEKSSSLSGFCLPRGWEETAPSPPKNIRYPLKWERNYNRLYAVPTGALFGVPSDILIQRHFHSEDFWGGMSCQSIDQQWCRAKTGNPVDFQGGREV